MIDTQQTVGRCESLCFDELTFELEWIVFQCPAQDDARLGPSGFSSTQSSFTLSRASFLEPSHRDNLNAVHTWRTARSKRYQQSSPAMNARLMPRGRAPAGIHKLLGRVDPSCPASDGLGLKGVGGCAVIRNPLPL